MEKEQSINFNIKGENSEVSVDRISRRRLINFNQQNSIHELAANRLIIECPHCFRVVTWMSDFYKVVTFSYLDNLRQDSYDNICLRLCACIDKYLTYVPVFWTFYVRSPAIVFVCDRVRVSPETFVQASVNKFLKRFRALKNVSFSSLVFPIMLHVCVRLYMFGLCVTMTSVLCVYCARVFRYLTKIKVYMY